jgi:hypothetical protein
MDRTRTVEFLHDPSMGGVDSGKSTKRAKFAPAPDGKGIFLTLSQLDKQSPEGGGHSQSSSLSKSHSLPLSWAEVEVVKSIVAFALPRLIGIDRVFEDAAVANATEIAGAGAGTGIGNHYNNNKYGNEKPLWK